MACTLQWVALSVHGTCTQDIKSSKSLTKVYQFKANSKHLVTSIYQEISSSKKEQKSN